MAAGRRVGNIIIQGADGGAPIEYEVREHGAAYQPPQYILNCQTLSRELRHNGERVPFFKGVRGTGRVTFEDEGVWFFIDQRDNENNPNLWELFFNVPDGELIAYEYSTTPEFEQEILNSPFRERD